MFIHSFIYSFNKYVTLCARHDTREAETDTAPLHSAYIPIGERHYAKDHINQWKLQLPQSYDRQTQCVMTAHHG